MKANQLVWLFLILMLSVVAAQQTNILSNVTTNETIAELKSRAENGDAESQTKLGTCYYEGDGVTNDFSAAVKWYRKAAEQNYAKAQCSLGVCYENGQGVATNQVEAVKWFRRAAEQNLAFAQFNMGLCYDNGDGVTEDKVLAVKWYWKAAEQGDADAQFNLGECYANGEGVTKNMAEAMSWYRKAAEQGDVDAKAALDANRKGFSYYLTNVLMITAFIPAIAILFVASLSALRKIIGNKPNEGNQ